MDAQSFPYLLPTKQKNILTNSISHKASKTKKIKSLESEIKNLKVENSNKDMAIESLEEQNKKYRQENRELIGETLILQANIQ